MKKTIKAYKSVGDSPLDVIKKIKKDFPELEKEKMAYAGRLDPLAEGVVLIIVGDELKKFDEYLKLDKEYEADILFGFSSDTYDVLGIPERKKEVTEKKAVEVLKKMEGDFCFSLPPFSGYKVKKKPLFQWTLEERINEIKIPEKKVKIYKMDILEIRFLGKKETKKEILGKVKKIKGDFRQKEIMEKWKEVFRKEDDKEKYLVVKIKVFCSSGCYIRSIADEAGKFLESGAVVLHLKRTRVGEKTLDL